MERVAYNDYLICRLLSPRKTRWEKHAVLLARESAKAAMLKRKVGVLRIIMKLVKKMEMNGSRNELSVKLKHLES